MVVSIPDRVLGIFRLSNLIDSDARKLGYVSIPDRVLGIFRLDTKGIEGWFFHMFQSLIGF